MLEDVYIHPDGRCETKDVGTKTKIWAFAHILPKATIGCECNICDHVFIENDVIIGDRVTIKSGVQLWDGVRLEDNVFIGPNATFTNDIFPRSKHYPNEFMKTTVKSGASIGANATILPGISIGQNAMVGAGAVVTRDVPPNTVVAGNPARIISYATPFGGKPSKIRNCANIRREKQKSPLLLEVDNCSLWSIPSFKDLRGSLVPVEFETHLPFVPKRQFFVYNVSGENVRGEHAHKTCAQFLIAVHGTLNVVVDNGANSCEVHLDRPDIGLYIPSKIWGVQYKFTKEAVLAVYASHQYDPNDYIRNYQEFLLYIKD